MSKRPCRYGRPGRAKRPGPVRTAWAVQEACRIRPIIDSEARARAGTARPWWLVPEHADHSSAPFQKQKSKGLGMFYFWEPSKNSKASWWV
jgi:hypothetical protein